MMPNDRPSAPIIAFLSAGLCLLAVSAACSRGSVPPSGEETSAAPAPAAETAPASTAQGAQFAAAGVRWASPAQWTAETGRPMRVISYVIPAAAGDAEGGDLGVFFFGSGQGGDVESNLERWYGQFVQADGRPVSEAERREKRTIAGLPVTLVELSGTYMTSPFPMSPEKNPKPGYRMLGAIVEAPEGNVFFKLTAPEATARAAAPEFEALLGSLTRG